LDGGDLWFLLLLESIWRFAWLVEVVQKGMTIIFLADGFVQIGLFWLGVLRRVVFLLVQWGVGLNDTHLQNSLKMGGKLGNKGRIVWIILI